MPPQKIFKIWTPEMAFAAFWERILYEIPGFQNIKLMVNFGLNHVVNIKNR
jgi:hypothetical protein